MKKVSLGIMALLILSVLLTGCFSTVTDPIQVVMKKGGLAFKMDFSVLTTTISKVTVTLNNATYGTRTQDLMLTGKVAEGVISNLEAGMWHIRADVYDDLMNNVYYGESDVQILANQTATCEFVFEPAPSPTGDTGNVSIKVVVNDFANHKLIPQMADKVIKGAMNNNFYIMDGPNKIVGIYDSLGYNKMNQFNFSEFPTAIALSADESKLFVSFDTGKIAVVDLMGNTVSFLTSNLGFIEDMILVNGYLVVRINNGFDHVFYTLDTMHGTIVNTTQHPLPGMVSGMEYNTLTSRIYFMSTDYSTGSIYSLPIDSMGIFGVLKSIPTVSGEVGGAVRLINDRTELVTPSGNRYVCAYDELSDLSPINGTIGYSYWDITSDPMHNRLVMINRYDEVLNDPVQIQLHVLDPQTFYLWQSIQLEGHPKRIFLNNDNTYTLIVEKDYTWYFRKISF